MRIALVVLAAALAPAVCARAEGLTADPAAVTVVQGGAVEVVISGSPGPFSWSGCDGIANAAIGKNKLLVVGLQLGRCAIVVRGPGDLSVAIDVFVTRGMPGP